MFLLISWYSVYFLIKLIKQKKTQLGLARPATLGCDTCLLAYTLSAVYCKQHKEMQELEDSAMSYRD